MKAMKLNTKEQEIFDFCIKMGDSKKLAYEAVLIERKKYEFYECYNNAYTN